MDRTAIYTEMDDKMASFIRDKSLLMQNEDKNGNNMYHHIKECLKYFLTYTKSDTFTNFERISMKLKQQKQYMVAEEIRPDNPALVSTAKIQQKLFTKVEGEEDEPVIEENAEHPLPNVMESAYQLELAGIGLGSCETVSLSLAIKQLVNSIPAKSVRFWGKIFGILQNVYVVEVEFEEGEDVEEDEEEENRANDTDDNDAINEVDDDEEENSKDVLPKNKWKAPPKVPKEPNNQSGVNKKSYFVCHEPGLKWIRLPPVTPQQIVSARSICCLFTGNLDATVNCSPSFPGTEAHYLRAQIARISASTQISPEGYFQLGSGDEEEEEQLEDEEGNAVQNCSKNPEYEPLPVHDLVDASLEHWVHHTPYIIPQGRVTWWNPSKNADGDLDDMLEEEDEDENSETNRQGQMKPERGPPILTRISTDLSLFGQPAWSARLSSKLVPEHASVVVSSNLWPGAHAVAWGKHFENVYIGWGLKASGPGFQPHLPVDPLDEYENIPELCETIDPTPEEEAALRASLNKGNVEDAADEDDDDGAGAELEDEEDN